MKKAWFLIGTIMLLITTYVVTTTYAKYSSNARATASKEAGAWIVKLNNVNIATSSLETEFTIEHLKSEESEFVAANKIAPSSSGYFDIGIDTTGNSVAVKYEVTVDLLDANLNNKIKLLSACTVVNGSEIQDEIIKTGEYTYTGIIKLDDVKNGILATSRFYVEWEDDKTGTNDEEDSKLGLTKDSSMTLPVKVVVSQYLGEKLVEYNENIQN